MSALTSSLFLCVAVLPLTFAGCGGSAVAPNPSDAGSQEQDAGSEDAGNEDAGNEDAGVSCGGNCTADQVCSQGVCVDECSAGLNLCSQDCVDLESDMQNCGACGETCDSPSGTATSCELGVCSYSCESDYLDCDGDTLTVSIGDGCETLAEFGCSSIQRVSVSGFNGDTNGANTRPAISSDGRFITFQTIATNLVGSMPNGISIVLRDRVSHTNEGINRDQNGVIRSVAISSQISGDGRFVTFSSTSSQLVDDDQNQLQDVFRRDRDMQATELISEAVLGGTGDGSSSNNGISDTGRFVSFSSHADNLLGIGELSSPQTMLRDFLTGSLSLVSQSSSGEPANAASRAERVSADGRYVVLVSSASNLVDNDTNETPDVFVRDMLLNSTTRVSLTFAGFESTGGVSAAAASADTRQIVWNSSANDLVPNEDSNSSIEIFVRDLDAETTEKISVNVDGEQGNGANTLVGGSMSADGRFVCFGSSSSDLVLNDTNALRDIFIRDRMTQTTHRISQAADGQEANGFSIECQISADGKWAVFSSNATNLVAGDTNGMSDIFVARVPRL